MLHGQHLLRLFFGQRRLTGHHVDDLLAGFERADGADVDGADEALSDEVIEALRNGSELADPKLEALRTFAIRINETRGWPDQQDIDALLSAGYTQRTVLEVILGTSLKVMSNYTNHIAGTPLDSAFKAVEWTDADLACPAR